MAAAMRTVSPDAFWNFAIAALGRLACEEADPTNGLHDHSVCIRDDVSYAADMMLRVAAAAYSGDEGALLEATIALQNMLGGQS